MFSKVCDWLRTVRSAPLRRNGYLQIRVLCAVFDKEAGDACVSFPGLFYAAVSTSDYGRLPGD
jgi:hypothetical protein